MTPFTPVKAKSSSCVRSFDASARAMPSFAEGRWTPRDSTPNSKNVPLKDTTKEEAKLSHQHEGPPHAMWTTWERLQGAKHQLSSFCFDSCTFHGNPDSAIRN
eukprot:2987095-Amphidinium_carterae.1